MLANVAPATFEFLSNFVERAADPFFTTVSAGATKGLTNNYRSSGRVGEGRREQARAINCIITNEKEKKERLRWGWRGGGAGDTGKEIHPAECKGEMDGECMRERGEGRMYS